MLRKWLFRHKSTRGENYTYISNMRNIGWILGMIAVLVSWNARATHLAGSQFTYTHDTLNTYNFEYALIRDCGGIPFDPVVTITIHRRLPGGTYSYYDDISVNVDSVGDVDFLSDTCVAFMNEEICAQAAFYPFSYALPPGYDYMLVRQRCCRNEPLVNVVDPLNSGGTYFVEILDTAQGNSSAQFAEWPVFQGCVGGLYSRSMAATDADGDSLSYHLVDPLDENQSPGNPNATGIAPPPPYPIVDWETGYNATLPINSSTPVGIDPVTGLLNFTPSLQGFFLMNVEVREWRNGQVINAVRREFEVMIGICQPRPTAQIEVEFDCATNSVIFYPSEPNGQVTWNVAGSGTAIPSADTLYWTPDENDTTDILVDFEFYLQSSACSIRDTLDYRFIPVPDFEAFGPDSLCQDENGEFYLLIDGQFQEVAWIIGSDTVSSTDDFSESFDEVGSVEIQYVLRSGDCVFSDQLDVYIQNCNEIQFPNVFTPNGDGTNDYWTPLPGYRVSQIEIVIYNRWGRMVWESRSAGDVAWDGTNINNGKPCSEGTYYYVYKADVPENPRGQGFITLLRE